MTRTLLKFLNAPILILFVVIGIALQTSLFSPWPLFLFQPDLVLIVVVWCALKRNFTEGGVVTLLMAGAAEIHSSCPQGVFLLCYMLIYLGVRASSRWVTMPGPSSYSTVTMVSSMAWKLLELIVLFLLGASDKQWKHTLTYFFISAGVNGALSIWIFRWLNHFDILTFKNPRAELALEEDVQLESEGF